MTAKKVYEMTRSTKMSVILSMEIKSLSSRAYLGLRSIGVNVRISSVPCKTLSKMVASESLIL